MYLLKRRDHARKQFVVKTPYPNFLSIAKAIFQEHMQRAVRCLTIPQLLRPIFLGLYLVGYIIMSVNHCDQKSYRLIQVSRGR